MDLPVVVALNRFPDDTDEVVQAVLDQIEADDSELQQVYDPAVSLPEKIRAVATLGYGTAGVTFTADASITAGSAYFQLFGRPDLRT